jgi:hypothetical protein
VFSFETSSSSFKGVARVFKYGIVGASLMGELPLTDDEQEFH